MSVSSSFARRRNGRWLNHHRTLTPAVQAWAKGVIDAEGTYSDESVRLADRLDRALVDGGFYSKIVYSLPFFGAGNDNLRCAFQPLHNTLSAAYPTNGGPFVGSTDHAETNGLNSPSGGKYIDTHITPSQLGTSNNGGIGYWALDVSFAGSTTEVVGCYGAGGASRFVLDLRTSRRFFSWGSAANLTDPFTASVPGFHYGQRSSATLRELFIDGISVSSNSASDAAAGASDQSLIVMGANTSGTCIGRCGFFIMTDGTLTSTHVSDLDYIVRNYLMRKTGRI